MHKAEDVNKTKEQLLSELVEARKRIAELEASEAEGKRTGVEYRAILQTAMDGFWLVDERGRFLDVNDAYCHLTGYSREELLNMGIFDVDVSERKEIVRHNRQVMETGQDHFDTTHRCKDGRIVDLEVSVSCVDMGERKFFVFFHNITNRKRALETLAESERRYRSLFSKMLNGYAYCQIIVDENEQPVDFVYLEVNDAFERLTGLRKENVIGRKVTEAIPGTRETHPELFRIYGKVALTGEPTQFDLHFKPLGIWLTISVFSPQKDDFVAVFDNITERKQAEEALRQSEERFRLLATNARDMVYRIHLKPELGFDYISPSVSSVMGYTPEECYADFKLTSRSIHPDDLRTFDAWIRSPDQYSEPLSLRVTRKDGVTIWCEFQNVSVYDEAGRLIAVEGIGRDITERKRVEETLEKKMTELYAVNQLNVKLANGRAELITSLQHRVDQLSQLHQIGKNICASASLGECLPAIASHLSEVLQSTLTTIVMIEADGTLSVSAEMGKTPVSFQERTRARGLTRAVIESRSILYVPNYAADPRSNPVLVSEGIKSWVGIPLVVEGKVRGVLIARSRQEDAFVDDMVILDAFAQWAVQAIRFVEPSWTNHGKPFNQSGRQIDN